MRQEEFEQRYQEQWKTFENQISIAESIKLKKSEYTEELNNFSKNYRQVCYCLALARERQYSPYLVSQLEAMVFRGHQIFYRKKVGIFRRIYQFILFGLPVAVREQATFVWIACALFYIPGLVVFIFTLIFPELVYSVVDSSTVANIEGMYDPSFDKVGRERQSDTDFMMFGHYIRNNIGIAFQSFAGGILATLGTQFYLIYNGIFFGAIDAHIINIGYQETFYGFVAGHSSYELTGIILSGAAGLQIGWAFIAPGVFTRRQAIINAGQRAMTLVYGAILLLLIAAFVEAFWSSTTSIPVLTKYGVGIAGWLFIIFYFALVGRGRRY
ncbi:stage II sporulation protein M [Aliikangiella sp. IMCC44359]|uniref:stage II sporulation protein M n=1 Tax=Aliikangiella sp. IMCC44359 TaxID=3459125 RepID=UPI00403AEDA3